MHLDMTTWLVRLLAYSFSATAVTIKPLNITSSPAIGKYRPLPNPYHVPNSAISLDFDFDHGPGSRLNARDVTEFCYRVRGYFGHLEIQRGDQEITPGEKRIELGILSLHYSSDPHFRMMRYSDIVTVAEGFLIKFQSDGFVERTAIVTYEYPGGFEIETGEVSLGLRIEATNTATA